MQRKHNQKKTKPLTPSLKKFSMTLKPALPLSPEVEALERRMIADLKRRRLDLEDRLYDKVQKLKEICKQEYNLTEKFPIEYLRYLLPDEERPVLKRRVGASYPVQLRLHTGRGSRREDEASSQLLKLESECDLLNQITKAAYQLAYDPSSKGRTKKKRLQSYQKSLKKLQDMENRVDELRKRQGQDCAFRQSTLIMTSDLDIASAMKECSIGDKSEQSSLSDAIVLDDETSLSSGAEALSTHSTPALPLRLHSGSADVDMEDIPLQRSRTPPPMKTKVAWLDSPRVRMKQNDGMTPNHSYPVLPSPASSHSVASHSSGAGDSPLHRGNGKAQGHRWDYPKRLTGLKASSVDSLESFEGRNSGKRYHEKQSIQNDGRQNANVLRIARATEYRAKTLDRPKKHRATESSRSTGKSDAMREVVQSVAPDDGKDSRTSLTDSGHGTDSRVQSCHEEEVGGRKNGGNKIRRDVSDSSLSELSTQSTPAPTNGGGHLPKFVPYFMTMKSSRAKRDRQTVAVEKENEQNIGHVRKRSSSFTESGSMLRKTSSKRDNMRTLARSMTQEEKLSSANAAGIEKNGGALGHGGSTTKFRQGGNESHSPIVFDSNLNICKQYGSPSQGQLAQDDPSPYSTSPLDMKVTSGLPYVSVVDKQPSPSNPPTVQRPIYSASSNNSNNKLNFGQIYKISQAQAMQDGPWHHCQNDDSSRMCSDASATRNISKCNSLDSVLDRGHKTTHDMSRQEHLAQMPSTQYPPLNSPHKYSRSRSITPHAATQEQDITNRNEHSKEPLIDIQGMSWVPSLDEYGSRASVAESLPAKSKRQDIRDMLQQHFAHHRPKRSPSSSSTSAARMKQDRRLQAMSRVETVKAHNAQTHPDGTLKFDSAGNTGEDYIQNSTLKRNRNRASQKSTTTTAKTNRREVNLFAHKSPPPLPQQKQGNGSSSRETAGSYSPRVIHKGHATRNGYFAPALITAMDESMVQPLDRTMGQHKSMHNPRPDEADFFYQGKIQQSHSLDKLQSQGDDTLRRIPESDNGAMVIQATRTSPNGHKVSIFTVKSAPNTPLPPKNEQGDENSTTFFGTDFDTLKGEISFKSTVNKRQPFSGSKFYTGVQCDTDFSEALLTKVPQTVQKGATSLQGGSDKFTIPKNPPPLPFVGPNATQRSSVRSRRALSNPGLTGTPAKSPNRATEPAGFKRDTTMAKRITAFEKGSLKSKSIPRTELTSSTGRSVNPGRLRHDVASIPVRDLRSGAKPQKLAERLPSPTPATARFQRTLSTPNRVKPAGLRQQAGCNSGSPQYNKNSGMHKESMNNDAAKSRPPAIPRANAATPIPARSFLKTTTTEQRQVASPKAAYQIRQSGTLPRTPKSHKRIERSGSTSATVYQAGKIAQRVVASQPQSEPRSSYNRSYIPEPRKNLRNPHNQNEDLKYKRSLSETWRRQQQNLGAVDSRPSDQRRYQHYHIMQHSTEHRGSDPRVAQGHPRRTASAEDLLWTAPEGRGQGANLNMTTQQGTLV